MALRETNTGARVKSTGGHHVWKTSAGTINARTQNQHYQRVLAVVDSFPKLLLVLMFTGMAGVYTAPRPGLPPHTETSASVSK